MAAGNEILLLKKHRKAYNSAFTQDSCTIPTDIPVFWARNLYEILSMFENARELSKFKMAAHKPEMRITRIVYKITAKFQRTHPNFLGSEFQPSVRNDTNTQFLSPTQATI